MTNAAQFAYGLTVGSKNMITTIKKIPLSPNLTGAIFKELKYNGIHYRINS